MKLQKLVKRYTWIAVFFLVTCIGFPLSQFADDDAFNISKLGELAGYGSSYEDVAVSGNYAYCVGAFGLDIVDISTPSSPRLMASYPGSSCRDEYYEGVETVNKRAYILDGYYLKIIDVSSPTAPSLFGSIKLSSGGEDLFIEGGYAYIGSTFNETIDIIDISGPTPPTTITTYHAGWWVNNLHVSNGYLYAAAGNNGVQILDVSTPTAPFWVAEIESVHDDVEDIFITGNYAYVLEEYYGLIIYDVSTPQSPVKTGEYEINGYYDGVHVAGSLAFMWDDYRGVKIIDVSNPSTPVLITDYRYYGDSPLKIQSEGDRVYIADYKRGFRIIDATNPADPRLLGSLESYGTGRAMALYGNYMYMGKSYACQALDISDPSAPRHAGIVTIDERVSAVAIKGAHLFVSVGGDDTTRFQVYNLSNPASPTHVGEVSISGDNGYTYFISIKGNYAYMGSSDYLRTFDISDPANPVQTGKISVSASYLCFNGNYAYLRDYYDIKVLDMSSPAVPKVLNTLDIYARRMVVKGNYAYIVSSEEFFIYDLSDPVSPSLVSRSGDYWYIEHLTIEGNYVYLVDSDDLLEVIDISDPVLPKVMGFYELDADIETITVRNNVIYSQNEGYWSDCIKNLHILQFQPDETPSKIALDRNTLYFSAVVGGADSPAQSVWVTNQGGASLSWYSSRDEYWIRRSSTGGGKLKVWLDTYYLDTAGSYTGTLTVKNGHSAFDTQDITVHVQVYEPGTTAAPFGQTATPLNGAVVSGSVPFTGWALDDVGVKDVKLHLKTGNTLTPVGDALFVAGARPDIESGYPTFPQSYKAGWGYMMLTNFLPGGGNGTYTIRAIATDMEGNETILGTTTIHVDNANAVKPFGAVDTPAPGGTASGSDFINHGWVLTPPPNWIPTGGSTITVWVDGQPLGHPIYSQYRSDIADLFPGYNNSKAAGGYYYLNTTRFANGVHTISWTAEDNVGNAEGIGSRYFSIQNSNIRAGAGAAARKHTPGAKTADVDNVNPVQVRKGFGVNAPFETLYPGESGDILVEIQELERLEILLLPPDERVAGVVAGPLVSLPIGASLDAEQGVFYWIPGPGFVGDYALSFWVKDASGDVKRKKIHIRIHPKRHEAASAIN